MVDELPGESLPDGIEVDDAAAYFGITESSDMVHTLMAMERVEAMEKFFEVLSDIVLLPGEFDFTAASERIQCEGGEIYYLVAGHLGIMTMPDPLLSHLGLANSSSEASTNNPALSEGDLAKLTVLADPMKILKLLAIAFATGGKGEVTRYLHGIESALADPAGNHAALLSIADELEAALDVAGHALPIPTLASGEASSASVATVPKPAAQTPAPKASNTAPNPSPVPLPKETAVPLPGASEPAPPKVELPAVMAEPSPEPAVDTTNEKQVAKATQDAFAGAFDIGLKEEQEATSVPTPSIPTPEAELMSVPVEAPPPVAEQIPVPEPEPAFEVEAEPEPVAVVEEPLSPLEMPISEEELFTSAAEHFIAADTDGSEQLSIEELAVATGTTLEEATQLHAEADTDGDGSVSLSEFMSSPAAEKTSSLPRPVAPIRKPLNQPQPQQQQPQQQQPQQQPPQQQQPQQQGWSQEQQQQAWNQQQQQQQQAQQGWNQQQQQGWNQQPTHQWNQPHPTMPSVQPTIRSGVMCRGCGIGLDPYWRFCPICGTQNNVQ